MYYERLMCPWRFKMWPIRNQNKIHVETNTKLNFMNKLLEMRDRESNFETAISCELWAVLFRVTLMKFHHFTLYKRGYTHTPILKPSIIFICPHLLRYILTKIN
jgi:hypothetical protein